MTRSAPAIANAPDPTFAQPPVVQSRAEDARQTASTGSVAQDALGDPADDPLPQEQLNEPRKKESRHVVSAEQDPLPIHRPSVSLPPKLRVTPAQTENIPFYRR